MWTGTLRANYDNKFEQFEHYAEMYGIHTRLGFKTIREAWNANPEIQVSANPNDLKITAIRFGTATLKPIEGTIEAPDGHEPSVEALEATQVGDEFWPKGLQPNDFAKARDFYYGLIEAEIL